MKRKQCQKDEKGDIHMTQANLVICLKNQQAYQSKQLNESLHLQYYGFCDIDNLIPFKSLHTIFLNNNTIEAIVGLQTLTSLCTLNLSYNRIKQFKGLCHLINLHTIDLSNNLIQFIPQQEIRELSKLSQLKLANNKFSSYESVKAISSLSKTLTCLDLSSNEYFVFDPLFYSQLLSTMSTVTVLSLQNTTFPKSTPNYRKQTINTVSALLFLDDRPVTPDQRALAQAWKKGGLVLQKEVRQKIKQNSILKHSKIYSEMQQRTRIAQQKRKRVYDKLTHWQQTQLNALLEQIKTQDFQIESQQQKTRTKLRIEDFQHYLELMKNEMHNIDIEKALGDGKIEVPKMIIDKETPTCIYVYNVSQEQIPLIKEKYYPNDQREIIAVNYTQQSQIRWIKEYDALLLDCYNQLKGNADLLAPTFNLSLYEFDQNTGRKAKRFEIEELKEHLKSIIKEEENRQRSIQVLYELD